MPVIDLKKIGQPLTIGVEEEFHIVDLQTRRPVPRAAELLARVADDRTVPELQASMVETNSMVCTTLDEVRADLGGLRTRLVAAATSLGLGVVAAGSVPLMDLDELAPWPSERNDAMLAEYAVIAREQIICGVQTQVGIDDRDLAARALSAALVWAPIPLALTASSPYWMGVDTGYASFRTQVWGRWPSAGVPSIFTSAAHYDAVVSGLVDSGVILDRGMVYFDGRLSVRFPTVEFRVCDASPLIDDVILVTGLWRALALTCIEALDTSGTPDVSRELVQAARWRAARSGLSGSLIAPTTGRAVPATDAVELMLDHVRPALEALGDWEQVRELATAALARGGSAQRQRAAAARTGGLTGVVDALIEETARR
jgi:carboxylate-amine ligase